MKNNFSRENLRARILFSTASIVVVFATSSIGGENEEIQKLIDILWQTASNIEIQKYDVFHKNMQIRNEVIQKLVDYGEMAIPVISTNLQKAINAKEYREVAYSLLVVLGKINSIKSEPLLIELIISDKDPYFRSSAVVYLGDLGSKKAIPLLIKCLEDKNIDVVLNAMEALSKLLSNEKTLRECIHRIIHSHPYIAIQAITKHLLWDERWSLLNLANDKTISYYERIMAIQAVSYLLEAFPEKIDTKLLKELEKLLLYPDFFYGVLTILKRYREEEYLLPKLNFKRISGSRREISFWKEEKLEILQNESEFSFLKKRVKSTLQKLDGDHKYAFLEELIRNLIDDQEDQLRDRTLHTISHGKELMVPLLLPALRDSDWEIRVITVFVLGGAKAGTAVPALIEALKDVNSDVRRYSAWALGEIRTKAETAVPALIQSFNDERKEVAIEAIRAVGEIGVKVEPSVPLLISGSKSKEKWTRLKSVILLGEIDQKTALVISGLAQSLEDEDLEVRRASAAVFSRIGPQSKFAVSTLIQALNDKDFLVKIGVAFALGDIGSEAESAVPALIQNLKCEREELKECITIALGDIGPSAKAAIPILIQNLKCKNRLLKIYTIEAFEKIKSFEIKENH